MNRIHYIDTSGYDIPQRLNNPFDYAPRPLCAKAAETVRGFVDANDEWRKETARRGKMFGVLLVKDSNSNVGFLAAYSGNLQRSNNHDYFVPPIFDATPENGFFRKKEAEITRINKLIDSGAKNIEALLQMRKTLSAQLQQELFDHYEFISVNGNKKGIREIFAECHKQIEDLRKADIQKFAEAARNGTAYIRKTFPKVPAMPPAAAGDCAAPKLLQYALANGLTPLSIAEFWHGTTDKIDGKKAGHFYPACISKCYPILTYMLDMPRTGF